MGLMKLVYIFYKVINILISVIIYACRKKNTKKTKLYCLNTNKSLKTNKKHKQYILTFIKI